MFTNCGLEDLGCFWEEEDGLVVESLGLLGALEGEVDQGWAFVGEGYFQFLGWALFEIFD